MKGKNLTRRGFLALAGAGAGVCALTCISGVGVDVLLNSMGNSEQDFYTDPIGDSRGGREMHNHCLVIYDSTYGNTKMVAETIGEAIKSPVLHASRVNPTDLKGLDLLIIGSPTHGGWYTPEVKRVLELPGALQGVSVASFDTRVNSKIGAALFGFAAPRLARNLQKKGARLVTVPEGFFVLDSKGPLAEGELDRAAAWAKSMDA